MRRDLPSILLILAMLVAGAAVYPLLPETVPSHWDLEGRVDDTAPKGLMLLVVPAFAVGLLLFLRRLHDAVQPDPALRRPMAVSRGVVTGFWAVMYAGMLGRWLGWDVELHRVTWPATGAVFVALAVLMRRLPPNAAFGIRLPATLADEGVWRHTHRVGAWTFGGLGVAVGVAGWLHPVAGLLALVLGALANLVVLMVVSERARG